MSVKTLHDSDEDLAKTAQVHSVQLPLEVLLSGVIYLSGGRAKDGTPIITCSPNVDPSTVTELKEKEALDLFLHFSTLPKDEDKNKGFTIIINGSTLTHIAMSTLLQAVDKFEMTLPGLLRWVLVIRASAIEQELHTQWPHVVSSATCKEVYLGDCRDLLKYIDKASLTSDLGGSMVYDHQEWVKYRLKIEPFMSDCKAISRHLSTVVDDLTSELPLTAAEAESALRSHQEKWSAMMKALHVAQLMHEGKRLITLMESPHPSLKDNPEFQSSLAYVRHLLRNVTEVKVKLDMLWTVRCTRLTDNFRARKFEEDANLMISWFTSFIEDYLTTDDNTGETLEEILGILEEVDTIEKAAQVHLKHCQSLISTASELLSNPNFSSDRSSIAELKEKLAQHLSTFPGSVERWKNKMEESMQLHALTHKVLTWCIATAEMLEAHDIRNTIITHEEVDGYMQDIDSWSSVPAVTDEELAKLEESAEGCILPYVQESAYIALNRTKELQERVRMHKEDLAKMLRSVPSNEKVGDPANQELIEGTKEVASALQGVLSTAVAPRDEGVGSPLAASVSPVATLKSQMGMIVLTPGHEMDKALEDLESAMLRLEGDNSNLVVLEENEAAVEEPSSPSSGKGDFIDSGKFDTPSKPIIEMVRTPEGVSDPAEQAKAMKMSKKRRNIIQELIETEEKYVRNLQHVVNHYIAEWEECMDAVTAGGTARVLPAALIGKRHTLFCNLEQLLQFTQTVFLPELRKLEKSPMRLGVVFCQFESGLTQYAPYFKNSLAQEAIMKEAGAKFFANTQLRLADPFNLFSYLVKPFERMARYKLFILEMIKNTPSTTKGVILDNLRKAERMVVFILRHGNDLLAVDNLSGVEGGTTQLGKIRRQGDLLSIEGMLKKPERRVFLFEQGIVIAKKQGAPKGSLMNEVFHMKTQLRLNELSMREEITEQPLRFELTDRKKVKYLLQASSKEDKEEWVSDLRDLFLEQMLALKEQAEQNYTYLATRGSGVDQEPIYGYSVRTPARLRPTTRSFRQPSRVGGIGAQRRLSSDDTGLLFSTRPTSGYSEFSMASTATSSTSGGSSQQPKVDISKPIQQTAEHVYEDISALTRALGNDEDDVPPPIPPRPPKPKGSEYEFIDTGEDFPDTGEGKGDEPNYQNVKRGGAEDEEPSAADP